MLNDENSSARVIDPIDSCTDPVDAEMISQHNDITRTRGDIDAVGTGGED